MTNKFEKVSFIVLLIIIILTPLALISSTFTFLYVAKTIVITLGILAATILYIISCFKDKSLSFPKHQLFTISCGIIISLIISTLESASVVKSFFGQGFEIGTSSFLIVLFLGSLLTVYLTHKDRDRVVYIFGAFFISFLIIAIFHVSRLVFGSGFLGLGIFQNAAATVLGKWTDLGLLSGVAGILSYIALRFINIRKTFKVLLIILAIVSAGLILIVNSNVVWTITLIVLILISITEYRFSPLNEKGVSGFFKKIPIVTCIIVLVVVLGLTKGSAIIQPSLNKLNINSNEVSLPWQFTLDVSSDTIKESPLFGAGPNKFMNQYLKFKPVPINSTVFWSTEFVSGFGLIPTFVVTQGLVGMILWLLLIISFVYTGFKALESKSDTLSRFFISSTFFPSLFLWISTLVYVPSHAILLMTFILSGLFLSTLVYEGIVPLTTIGQNGRASFTKFIPLILIVLIVVSIGWTAVFIKKELALGYFQSGINLLNISNNQNIVSAENNFKKALALDKNDTYYQALSEINILKINALSQEIQAQVQKTGGNPDPEKVKIIAGLVDQAVKFTQEAIKIDKTNYYNYIAEARISELALSLQIPNAYENVRNAYAGALNYNPYNPSLYLSVARIDASQNKIDEAKKDIGLALQLKSNYIEAIFLLSQIQVAQGQIKDAITSVQVVSQINPTNPLVFFQLGLLYYSDKNYQSAVDALNQALKLDKQYANAQYFLGLSYARLNMMADAIIQFENLSKTNPDSQEVALILSNLKAGKSPFNEAKPPIDSKPEKRKTLPIPVKSK